MHSIVEKKLSPEDIAILKDARKSHAPYAALIFFGSLTGFGIYLYARIQASEFQVWSYLVLACLILVAASALKQALSYSTDIQHGEKIVLHTDCKIIIRKSRKSTRHFLDIKGYGEIDFDGYNAKVYDSLFSHVIDYYEIHLAPESQVILFAKKIEQPILTSLSFSLKTNEN